MKNIIITTVIVFMTLLLLVGLSEAGVPHVIRFQGKLTDRENNPLNDTYRITFRIYDALTSGNNVWTETHQNISVINGVFTVLLGSVNDDQLNLSFDEDEEYWLSIQVEGDSPMIPRQQITSSLYAYRAESADQAEIADRAEVANRAEVADRAEIADRAEVANAAEVAYSVNPQGPNSRLDADTVDGYNTATSASANCIPRLNANGHISPFYKSYDSGWFSVTYDAAYAKNHNLGTTKALFLLYFATNANGADMQPVTDYTHYDTLKECGGQVQDISANSCSVRTGVYGVCYEYHTGGRVTHRSGYFRLIALALE